MTKTALLPAAAAMPTQRLPEIPTRELAAMQTQLMATQRMELAATRASELPAEMASALARVAEAAARFATNEARVCVRTLLVAFDVGAIEEGKRYLAAYIQRLGFIGEPTADVQQALRAELALAYARMAPELKCQFDKLFFDSYCKYPKAWITRPFAR